MKHPLISRLASVASVAVLAATGVAIGGAAHAAPSPHFSVPQGWRVDQHPRELADVNGDGWEDIVGFGDAGVWVSYAQLNGYAAPHLVVPDFGRNQGWRVDRHPRQLVDLNGNGTADIVGFGDAGAYVSSYSGPGDTFTAAALAVPNFGHQQGSRVGRHPRELGDVNGDGRADIVGYGCSGVSVAYSQGHLSFSGVALKVRDLGQVQGWQGDRHPRTLADIDGDGIQDLVGFGNAGVHVAHGRSGDVFGTPYLTFDDFGYDDGWRTDRHLRLLGDADGNGRDDVVAFGDHGLYLSRS